ncbi:MAG TPA: hypothetical protein VNS63_03215, partial [Blastocatellia bacterium]|nr:hypothetical protein [Blastocatellia bacterium]
LAEVVSNVTAVNAIATVSLMDARCAIMLNLPLEVVHGDPRFAHLPPYLEHLEAAVEQALRRFP